MLNEVSPASEQSLTHIRFPFSVYRINERIPLTTVFWETLGKNPFIRLLTTWLMSLSFLFGEKCRGEMKFNSDYYTSYVYAPCPRRKILMKNDERASNVCNIIVRTPFWFRNYAYSIFNAKKGGICSLILPQTEQGIGFCFDVTMFHLFI